MQELAQLTALCCYLLQAVAQHFIRTTGGNTLHVAQGPAWSLAKTASRLCKAAMLQQIKQLEAAVGFKPTSPLLHSISSSCDTGAVNSNSGDMHLKRDVWASCAESTAIVAELSHNAASTEHEAETGISYAACKQRKGSAAYMGQWCGLRKINTFQHWINKPQFLEDFMLI